MKPKIIFFGSDQYSRIVLKKLQKDGHFDFIKAINSKNALPDVGVVASFGFKLPADMINAPRKGILNIHPSLLPKYRGTTPVPTAIINGDKVTGVTIIKIDNKFDHGPIIAQAEEEIKTADTSESLLKRLFTVGAEILVTILPAYLEGRIKPREQDHSQATYTKKFTREDGQIDWQKDPFYLDRFIRAMTPWPGAWTHLRLAGSAGLGGQAKRLKILKAHLQDGKLALDVAQLEGKNPVTWKQFQEGYPEAELVVDKPKSQRHNVP